MTETQPKQDAAKWSSNDAADGSARSSGPRAPSYDGSTCAWLYFVPELAVACELRELNKQLAHFIEETDMRAMKDSVNALVQKKEHP